MTRSVSLASSHVSFYRGSDRVNLPVRCVIGLFNLTALGINRLMTFNKAKSQFGGYSSGDQALITSILDLVGKFFLEMKTIDDRPPEIKKTTKVIQTADFSSL